MKKHALQDVPTAGLLRARRYGERQERRERTSPALDSDPSSDSDGEDYVRFPPGGLEVQGCPDEALKAARKKGDKSARRGFTRHTSSSSSRDRGRAPKKDDANGVERNHGAGRRRAWREPSPYVWRINEEREDGAGNGRRQDVRSKSVSRRLPVRDLQPEEPVDEKEVEERLRKRKVRFVLPAMD